MTKNWQEEFNREFTTLGMGNEICSHQDVDDIKQFISDIRKHDMEELIKMLKLKIYQNPDNYGRVYNESLENSIKLIKNYYAK